MTLRGGGREQPPPPDSQGALDRASLRLIVGMAIAVAGLFLPATEAFALWDDKLKLFAEEKITHDDNVFRFSRDLDPV